MYFCRPVCRICKNPLGCRGVTAVKENVMSRNADMERASTVKQLTSFFMHKHYCENDVEAIISYFSDDLAWIGAAEHEYAVGGEVITQIFRQFTGKLPPASSMGKSTTPYSFPRIFFCVRECCTLPRIRSPISACAFTNESRPSSVGNPVRRGAATSISRTPIRKWWTATWAFLKK